MYTPGTTSGPPIALFGTERFGPRSKGSRTCPESASAIDGCYSAVGYVYISSIVIFVLKTCFNIGSLLEIQQNRVAIRGPGWELVGSDIDPAGTAYPERRATAYGALESCEKGPYLSVLDW